ncbi:hypothetical protein K7432_008138 [Basidiobolus ranarum]
MPLNAKDKEDIIARIQEVSAQNKKTHDRNEKTRQRLALLDRKMSALLTQNYELHELTIPRMFIILPVDIHPANPAAILTNEYRLYFLCECGEHTESKTSNLDDKHAVHIALHEGYEISKPTELYAKYGLYMLYLLRALRFGLQIAGVSIPAISQNTESDRTLEKWIDLPDKTLDASITFIDTKLFSTPTSGSSETAENERDVSGEEYFQQLEALEEGDLRQLGMFISDNGRYKVHGNLYRIITEKGHVKWVCLSHYRANYGEAGEAQFKNAILVQGGDYDEHLGKVVIILKSVTLAEEFTIAIAHAKQLQELDVSFQYKWQSNDLKLLDDAIRKTTIRSLTLDVSCRDLSGFNNRASVVRNMMSNKQLQTIQMKVDDWFVENGLSSIKDLSHVKILEFRDYLVPNDPWSFDTFGGRAKERRWMESMSAMLTACPFLERMSFDVIEQNPSPTSNMSLRRDLLANGIQSKIRLEKSGHNSLMSLANMFSNYCRLVDHYSSRYMFVSRKDIAMVAGLSAMEELTSIKLSKDEHLADMLEMESRNGDIQLKKLELTCHTMFYNSEVEAMTKFLSRLKLTHLELSIYDECNVAPILHQIDFSSLTTFILRGKIDDLAWEVLEDGLKGSMVKELTIVNTDTADTDNEAPRRVTSNLTLEESRNGDTLMKKLELTLSGDSSTKEVETIALLIGRLRLTHIELSTSVCNIIAILQQIDYSSLTAFTLKGKIDVEAWKALDDGFQKGSMVQELTLLNMGYMFTYAHSLPSIVSGLSLKSLYTYKCRGMSDEEWASMLYSMDISQLAYLNISYSEFGDMAVNSLIDRLPEAEALSHLVLCRTPISERASNNLIDAIKYHERSIVYQRSPHFPKNSLD